MRRQLVLIFVIALVIFVCMGNASGATRYVDPGDSIQSVINNVNSGDTIVFRDGTYYVGNTVSVNKPLTLIAQHSGSARLVATNNYRTVISVRSSAVMISGLVIDGNHRSAYAINANPTYMINNCHISGNTIINNNEFGILLSNTINSQFSGNTVTGNGWVGMGLLNSYTATLTGNTVTGSGYSGIYLENTPASTLTGNIASGNGLDGIILEKSPSGWIENNNVNNNARTGINLYQSSGGFIQNNNANNNVADGISLGQSSGTGVFFNTANGNGNAGIWLSSTYSTTIAGNTFQYNPYGAGFGTSNSNTFSYNLVTNGIYGITSSYTNTISNNRVFNNSGWGISMDTYGNDLEHHHLQTTNFTITTLD